MFEVLKGTRTKDFPRKKETRKTFTEMKMAPGEKWTQFLTTWETWSPKICFRRTRIFTTNYRKW